MGWSVLLLRRARHGGGLLLTILLLAATTTAIIAGTLGYSQAAATTAARSALTDATPTEAGIRAQTRLAEDAAAQDAAARARITEAFAPADVAIQRTLVSEPRPVEGRDERIVVMAGDALAPGAAQRVQVTAGTWPQGPGTGGALSAALHAQVGELWQVGVGDRFTVADTEVVIEALWQPADSQAALWFGDPLVASGQVDAGVGPLVVDADAIRSFGSTPFTRWTVQPDAEEIRPNDLSLLAGAAQTLQRTLDVPEVEVRGLTVEGDLGPTAASAARNLATARALNVIPVVVLLLVSVLAVVQIARLQAAARSGEVEVLVARGASRRQLLTGSSVESLVVAVLATALGIAAALLAIRAVPAGEQQVGTMVRAGLGTGLAVLLALVAVAVLQVRAVADRSVTDRSGRARSATALAVVLLVPAAAALSWWQLDRYGSPLVTGEDGALRTDLVAGAAPALLLAAAAVLALALLGPASRLAESVSRRGRRLAGHLASAQVARRLVVYAVPVLLTVLAVGSTTLAGLYAATSAQLRSDLADVGQGADVRAELASVPVPTDTVLTLPDVSSVEQQATAPVWLAESRVGPTDAVVTVLPVAALDDVTLLPEHAADRGELAEALGPQPVEPAADQVVRLPDGPLTLTLDLTVGTRVTQEQVEREQQVATALEEQVRSDPQRYFGLQEVTEDDIERFVDSHWETIAERGSGEYVMQPTLQVVDPHTVGPQTVELDPVPFPLDWQVEDRQIRTGEVTGEATVSVDLPDGRDRVLTAVGLGLPQMGLTYQLDLTVEGITTARGQDLLETGDPLAWQAPPPATAAEVEGGLLTSSGSRTDLDLAHDAGAGTLTVTGTSGTDQQRVGSRFTRGETTTDSVPALLRPAPDGGSQGPLPVALTPALASANALVVGDPLTLTLFGQALDAEVATLVDAVPATLRPAAVLVDRTTWFAHLRAVGGQAPPPSELWFATDDADATVADLAGVEGIEEVRGPGTVAVTDAAGAVRLVFWVASTGAVLLAVTGIGAVSATLVAARRAEVAVLRALGMTPAQQSRSRAGELLGVVLAAVGLGLGAGWAVGALVVPELARSTTLAGQLQLPARLALELPLWLALIGLLVAAVLLTAGLVGGAVRRQSLDSDYREEIR